MSSPSFHDNPIVYHLLVDRFSPPPGSEAPDPCDFHGGRLSGVTAQIRAGWFSSLGVNAIWLSAPFEQIRGWVPGAQGACRHAPYHGYWPLDFTVIDERFGSAGDLHELVAAAHDAGIKLILDIVFGHAGYPDLQTFHELLPDALHASWREATPTDYDRHFDAAGGALLKWWGPAWVRAELPGYAAVDDPRVFWLPQFHLDRDEPVALPHFLRQKPGSRAVELPGFSVRQYLVKWLSDWVREFGIDGFRCDSAKQVPLRAWAELKAAGAAAYAQAGGSGRFWMVGEVYGAGTERSDYFDHGFDSVVNFDFQHQVKRLFGQPGSQSGYLRSLALHRLDKLYADYAGTLASGGHDVLSYLSSHDTELFERSRLADGALALLLAPGGVQVFYGDETGRPPGAAPWSDPAQSTRSDMNWQAVDQDLLRHWRRLCRFRSRHVALARGAHRKLCDTPYVFAREHAASGDRVVVAVGDAAAARIPVGGCFDEGQPVRDAYSGRTGTVADGHVTLPLTHVALLEALVETE